MGIYDDLMDPEGGRPYRGGNGLGLMAMDFGFGLFGKSIGNVLGRAGTKNSLINLRKQYRKSSSMLGSPGYIRQQARAHLKNRYNLNKMAVRGEYRSHKSFGKSLSAMGLVAGAIGLVDLALGIGASLASPSAARDLSMGQILGDDELMMDTRVAYTQRQRAIQAIHDSQMSVGRAIIGQEASYIHK